MSLINKLAKEEVNLKKIPIEIIRKEPKAVAIFLMIFGIIFYCMPIFGIALSYNNEKLTYKIFLLVLPFIIFGTGAFVAGYNFFVKQEKIIIDFDSIRYHFKSLFKKTKWWIESFSNYKGILHTQEHLGDKQYNVIKLYHEDEQKCILLGRYLLFWISDNEVRTKWEEFARFFNLPALRETSDGMIERSPQDLNKSSRKLAEEGKVIINESNLLKPPDDINVYFDRGLYVIAITKKRTLSPGLLIVAAIVTLLVYFGFFFKEDPDINFIAIGIFGAILGAYSIIYLIFDLLTTQLIKCSYEKIHILRKTPFGETGGKVFEVDKIEEVIVAKADHYNRETLAIITDQKKVNLGMFLPVKTLEWIRDFIYSKFS